jgi:hypothetical protein
MTYPFPADQIQNHRFHGLIQGTFTVNDEGHLLLQTSFGTIGLLARKGGSGPRSSFAARKQHQNHPNSVVNAYGYPRTSDNGTIVTMELCSWFVDGSPEPDDYEGIARRFQLGQLFLCGRVRDQDASGLITAKVKSDIPGVGRRQWFVTGRCLSPVEIGSKTLFVGWAAPDGTLMLQVDRVITPAGRKTVRASDTAPSVRPAAEPRDQSQLSSRQSKPASPSSELKRLRSPGPNGQQPSPGSLPGPAPTRRPAALQRPQR